MTKNKFVEPLSSARFYLKPLNRWQAFRLTYPWTKDQEFMKNYTDAVGHCSPWQWYRTMIRPNARTKFTYAIVPHGDTGPIGIHSVVFSGYKSCLLSVGIQDRRWWGEGVVQEVRPCLIDYILAHSNVQRFQTQVWGRNFQSIFNNRKLGFKHVATEHRTHLNKFTNEVDDQLTYEMFREEWMERKALSIA